MTWTWRELPWDFFALCVGACFGYLLGRCGKDGE